MMVSRQVFAWLRLLLMPGLLALVAFLGGPLSALAAYAPGTPAVAAPPGAFPTVLVSETIGAAGATVRLTSGAATLALVVPPGAFPSPVQLTIYQVSAGVMQSQLPAGYTLVDGFAVGWSPPTPAAVPLTFTVSDPSITPSTQVFETTNTGLVPFPGASVVAGSVTVTFTDDPGIILGQRPATPAQVAQAPAPLYPSTTASRMPTQLPSTGAGGTAGQTGAALPGAVSLLGVLGLIMLSGVVSTRRQPVRRPQ
jgi:hypothetical protein